MFQSRRSSGRNAPPCKALALDQVLARRVEMKLQQVIALIATTEFAAGRHVDLDRVAVVDDLALAFLPVKRNGRNLGLDCAGDVERRLLRADRAGGIVCTESTPVVGAVLAFIAPMRALRGEAGPRAKRAQSDEI